jgi:imidazole glycerol phosphate synthase glutamine amidotransferase subunit
MARLRELGFVEPLRARIAAGRPTLAICLGLQLLGEASEETPGAEGIGAIPSRATRFGDAVRVPHFGWNRITPSPDCGLLKPGFAYFANSYRLASPPPGWGHASCPYDGSFVAAIERGAVLACQFHPELSGELGTTLLRDWIVAGEQGAA